MRFWYSCAVVEKTSNDRALRGCPLLSCAALKRCADTCCDAYRLSSCISALKDVFKSVSYCVGKPRLPSVSDNLFMSGFIQVSNDLRVIIGAENSTVEMDYICQFNGTHISAHDPL